MKSIEQKTETRSGIWVDAKGNIHFSVPDLLDAFGWPHDEEHQGEVEDLVRQVLAENFPGARPIYLHRCPCCGVSGWTPHAERCPLANRLSEETA